jgi:hypothetical protein
MSPTPAHAPAIQRQFARRVLRVGTDPIVSTDPTVSIDLALSIDPVISVDPAARIDAADTCIPVDSMGTSYSPKSLRSLSES